MVVILKKGKIEEVNPLKPNSPKKVNVEETHLEFEIFQVSYNSWGHINIKGFNNRISSSDETELEINDVSIVLNKKESEELWNFIKKIEEV